VPRVVFNCRLIGAPDLGRWHADLERWAASLPAEITAEPWRLVLDADTDDADHVVARLIDAVLRPADKQGALVAVGIGAGSEIPMRLADGRSVRSSDATLEAAAVADAAEPGHLLVSGAARAALVRPWSFARPHVLANAGGTPVVELLWRDDDHDEKVTSRRMRGTVVRVEPDRTTVIAGDDGTSYWARTERQLAAARGPGDVVWFVRSGDPSASRPDAVAMAPVGATLTGAIQRQGERTLLRSNAGSGHWMTFVAADGDLIAESSYIGDRCRFRVADGRGGPRAVEIDREADLARPTLLERLLISCMDELARHGSEGAAAAVRRTTKNITTDADPALEEQRLWLMLSHAAEAWVLPALSGLPQAQREVTLATAAAAVGVRERVSARHLASRLRPLLDCDVRSTSGADLRPFIAVMRLAAHHAAQIVSDPSPVDVDHLARAASLLGDALAQALLCGVIHAAPAEAKHLARRLSAVKRPQPPEAAGQDEVEADVDARSDVERPVEPSSEAAVGVIRDLVTYAREQIVPRLTNDDPYRFAIPVALFARSVSLVESSLLLAEAGRGREIIILNRPLFELMVDAHWAAQDPERAEQCFVEQARHTQHLQRQYAQNHPELFPEAANADLLDAGEVRELGKKFGPFGHRSWTGRSLPDRVKAVAPMFGDAAEHLQLSYDISVKLANAEIHSTSWSLARALRRVRMSDGSEHLQVHVGAEPALVVTALPQTWWVFGQLLGLMHRLAEIDLEPLWELSASGARIMGLAR
jgi:hypothetical protein